VRGVTLYTHSWRPDTPPRAVVLLCSGVADHSGRYPHLVEALVAAGYAVHAYDHRGHGHSGGVRLHVERFEDFAADLKTFRDLTAGHYPGQPLYLFAHSMGSAVALLYLLDHGQDVAGAILSGVALYAGEGFPAPVLAINRFLSRLLPRLRLTSLPTAGISRDEAWVEATRRDPLVYHGPGTTRLGAEILDTLPILRARLGELRLPLLILQGEKDILVNPRGAQLLAAQAASADKTVKTYRDAYHEVFNDLPAARTAYCADVVAWLDRQTG
jgi:alpha-beta hydrolase superfamily lysophospholipase